MNKLLDYESFINEIIVNDDYDVENIKIRNDYGKGKIEYVFPVAGMEYYCLFDPQTFSDKRPVSISFKNETDEWESKTDNIYELFAALGGCIKKYYFKYKPLYFFFFGVHNNNEDPQKTSKRTSIYYGLIKDNVKRFLPNSKFTIKGEYISIKTDKDQN